METDPKVNLGCGMHKLVGWVNIDQRAEDQPDIVATVPPLPFPPTSVGEIYLGHFLEHLYPHEQEALLKDCLRVLKPGARIGIVVPNTEEILRRYIRGKSGMSLDHVCFHFLYSYVQPSHHRWSFDRWSLSRLMERFGFRFIDWMRPGEVRARGLEGWEQFGGDWERP